MNRVTLILLVSAISPLATANCTGLHCTLATTAGAYPNFILGKLTHVGTPTETQQLEHWAKTQGHWQRLPTAASAYTRYVIPVTIVAQGRPMTVFLMKSEYEDAPLRVGDLVRYRSHDAAHDAPPDPTASRLFHGLTGCVATLCTQGDKRCLARYRQGVFTPAGKQLNPLTGKPIAGGLRISLETLMPLAHQSQSPPPS